MTMTIGFKKWLVKEKEAQEGKLIISISFLLLPVVGELILLKKLRSPNVQIVREIGGNKLVFFLQAIIFKYLLWFLGVPVLLMIIAGFCK